MSHTPGPWKRLEKMVVGNLHQGKQGTEGDVVCLMKGYVDYRNQDDNARLIAAAPELLETCKEAKEWIEENPSDKRMPGWGRILDLMEAAIEKAERRAS